MRRSLVACCASLVFTISAPAASGATCGASLPANGTGYVPPTNAASLPDDVPRPGPDVLYRRLRGAPQLRNTGVWRAAPIMVSGATAYRSGEFVYQDWLYDDTGLALTENQGFTSTNHFGYPDDPRSAGDNAADIVEVRLKPTKSALAVRITYNSMVDPSVAAATIALGESSEARPMPHDAGAKAPAKVFVTAHGCSGDVVDAATGKALPHAPVVRVDVHRRQMQICVPYRAFDPRGRRAVRIAAATGWWDDKANKYLRPDPAKPAFYNVAFRDRGTWEQAQQTPDHSQSEALAAGDLTRLSATVDFVKLARGKRDETGVPRSGPMNRIMVSHFEPKQGRGDEAQEPDTTTPDGATDLLSRAAPCRLPKCRPVFSGRLEPYAVYVPDVPPPTSGYGMVLGLHGAGGNYNHFETTGPSPQLLTWQMWAEAGHPSIFVQGNARGPGHVYQGLALVDEFEAWADAAAHYPLNARRTFLTGTSMGGNGAYKFAMRYPDLFNAVLPNIPAVGINASKHASTVDGLLGPVDPVWLSLLPSLRNVPVIQTAGLQDPLATVVNTTEIAESLHQLGFRTDAWTFNGSHEEHRYWIKDAYGQLSRETPPNGRNPSHITYVLNGGWDEDPEIGAAADHAYWLSGLRRRDLTQQTGKIDVISQGLGVGHPAAAPAAVTAGTTVNGSPAWFRRTTTWGPAPTAPKTDALTITATNVSQVTINVDRAGVSCKTQPRVSSDGPLKVMLVGRSCPALPS